MRRLKKEKHIKVPFEKRPTCVCGVKMKWIEYQGYYEEFNYWQCDNCELESEIEKYEPDKRWRGSY